jgi:hypothetical protein
MAKPAKSPNSCLAYAYSPPLELGIRLVSWPNTTASAIAPTATTARTTSEQMPALARTAGIVKTPTPAMVLITRNVAGSGPIVAP